MKNACVSLLLFLMLAPAALGCTESVVVQGRVVRWSPEGDRPVARALVRLSSPDGSVLAAVTNSFGYYAFPPVTACGAVRVLEASHRHYVFWSSPRVLFPKQQFEPQIFLSKEANPPGLRD